MLRAADRACGCGHHPQRNSFQDYAGPGLEPAGGVDLVDAENGGAGVTLWAPPAEG